MIRLKRVYEEPSPEDGMRVLVERFWPRGISKERARIDTWKRELAPSDGLRKWYGHIPVRWPVFRELYRAELGQNREAVAAFRRSIAKRNATLVFATRDPDRSSAAVLKEYLER
jgi:uncharacterized protein YeaO (DUF488 family)